MARLRAPCNERSEHPRESALVVFQIEESDLLHDRVHAAERLDWRVRPKVRRAERDHALEIRRLVRQRSAGHQSAHAVGDEVGFHARRAVDLLGEFGAQPGLILAESLLVDLDRPPIEWFGL
jgi:hypothetical protein